MLAVDRANYCAAQDPYSDVPNYIGYGATISASHMHCLALSLLQDWLVDGAKVLDVGSGSGYLTACMAHMVGPRGTVYGVDHIKQLVDLARENIRTDCGSLLSSGRVKLIGRYTLESSESSFSSNDITNSNLRYTKKWRMDEPAYQISLHLT